MSFKNVKLTPVEWEIMETIWEIGGKPSVREVVDFAYANGEKAYTTIQTMMNTLEKKGLLKREKIGMVNFYTAARTRNQMVKTELSTLVTRVFDGSVPAMANFLLDSENLSQDEIDTIKTLLNQKEIELKGK
ncbi:BlaI/MecI/CopY family transcriptional regulator [candidate division KSB1 bacterium]|nr:BlaI/MecI/CopY family transcriptional regulator [candidate division KSB1 bacterium]